MRRPQPTSKLFPYTTLFRSHRFKKLLAETEGFEPSIRFPVYTLSRRASSTTRASLQRSEEHTSELQSRRDLVCRLLLEKKKPGCSLAHNHSSLVNESANADH